MKINKLNLVNFRNYEEVEVEFQKGVNIIISIKYTEINAFKNLANNICHGFNGIDNNDSISLDK